MPNSPVAIYNTDLELVAYLENATGIAYKERKGEVWSASFCLPADDPKNDECQDFYYAEIFDGDTRVELFRIVLNGKSRIAGKPVVKYECKHALCTLNDDIMVGEHNAGPGVEAALNYILGKQVVTHWQLGTVDFVQNFYHYWKDLSLLAALYTVPERFLAAHLWTFDTESHPWTLNLLEAPTTVETRITYRKNMQQIDRKSDVRNLYTRLYPYGYGAGAAQVDISTIDLAAKGRPGFTSGSTEFTVGETLTGATSNETAKVKSWHKVEGVWGDGDAEGVVFLYDISGTFTDGEDLNGSVSGDNCATLDSSLECVYAENVTKYGVITRKWEDQRYTIVANLYAAAEEKVDANAVPELAYAIKAPDLYRLTGHGQFVLGDLVKVYDEPLGVDVDARIVTLSKKDVEGKPGDIAIQLGNKIEKFPDFGGIVYADDLDQVKDGTKWARVLSTQILAGEILLSAVPGSTIGAFPATPTVAGLYVGATHFGFHDGTNWVTYMDNAGKLYCEGIGGDTGHLRFDPAGGGSLDIKAAVTVTSGTVGGFNVDPTEGLYIGTGATRVQMKPGEGVWCGATAFADAPWRVNPAGAVTCTNLTVTGGSININSGVFSVSAAGALVATSATITGAITSSSVTITGGTLNINSGVFSVSAAGALVATSATITGTITGNAGTIGGFTISSAEGLYSGSGATRIQMKAGVGLWLGATAFASAPWRVSPAGAVTCSNLTVTGGTWGGDTLAVAKIPSLSCSKITSGTFDPVLIPTLTGDKISLTSYLAIKSTTYGQDGVQLQYNAGNPRAYIGNGASAFFKFDGTKITWKAANSELDASGNLTVANLSVGAGSTWGGNALGTAYIPNLDCNKITSGEFGTVRIPSLSCSKITSGTFDAVRIPNLSCDILTSGTLTGRTIRTAASGVRTQIDSSGGYSHYILQYDASKMRTSISSGRVTLIGTGFGEVTLYSTTENRINMLNLGGKIYVSGGALAIETAGGQNIGITSGNALTLTSAAGQDLTLTSGDDIFLNVADAATYMRIYDWESATGAHGSAAGTILVSLAGALREIRLYEV